MTTKVYKFWCEPSDEESKKELQRQFSLMRDYRYGLARLENLRREEGMLHARAGDDEFSAADIAERSLFDIPKNDRDEEWQAELERCRARRKKAYAVIKDAEWLREARTADFEIQKEFARAINTGLGPRGEGLSFATGQFCADAHKQGSDKTPIYKFLRVDLKPGEGVFAVHHQRSGDDPPLYYKQVVDAKKGLVRLSSEKSGLLRRSGRTGAARLNQVVLQISKGKTLSVHALLHREIPADAIISWVRVHAIRIGTKTRYSLQIVATHQVEKRAPAVECVASVSVDLGFRLVDEGYVVATARGSDGAEHELVIPHSVTDRGLDRFGQPSRCTTLRSTRDLRFGELKKALEEYVPEAGKWKSPSRAVRLMRSPAGEALPDYVRTVLAEEVKQDRHLWDWEAHNRAKMSRQISGRYQEFAAFLAKTYNEIRIEDLKVCQAKEAWRQRAADKYDAGDARSKQSLGDLRAVLKLGYLQKAIKDRATSFGTSVGEVRAAYTSRTCSACGHRDEVSSDKMLTCSVCGAIEDRDIRACKNIASAEVQKWVAGPLAEVKSAKRKTPRRKAKAELASDGVSA